MYDIYDILILYMIYLIYLTSANETTDTNNIHFNAMILPTMAASVDCPCNLRERMIHHHYY